MDMNYMELIHNPLVWFTWFCMFRFSASENKLARGDSYSLVRCRANYGDMSFLPLIQCSLFLQQKDSKADTDCGRPLVLKTMVCVGNAYRCPMFLCNRTTSHFLKHAVIAATAAKVPSGSLTQTVSIPISLAG